MAEDTPNTPARRGPLADVDPFFRDLFEGNRWPSIFRQLGSEGSGLSRWAPAMELTEAGDGYAITLELAGTKPEDIEVECHEQMLTVKGEKRSEREEKDEHRHYTERSFGSFSRSVRLPADAADDVVAKFKDGVLTIEVPKIEEKKPRTVSIES